MAPENPKTLNATITILDNRYPVWLRRSVAIVVLVFTPSVIAIYMGSAAMQWLAFVVGILFLFAFTMKSVKDVTFTSIADAKAYLDTLEGESK